MCNVHPTGKYINTKAQFSTKPSKTELIVISYAHSLIVRELRDCALQNACKCNIIPMCGSYSQWRILDELEESMYHFINNLTFRESSHNHSILDDKKKLKILLKYKMQYSIRCVTTISRLHSNLLLNLSF